MRRARPHAGRHRSGRIAMTTRIPAFARALAQPTTVERLAAHLSASTLGDATRTVRAVGSLSCENADVLAFCDATRRLAATAASVVVPAQARATPRPRQTLVVVDDVRAAFIDVVASLLPGADRPADPPPGVDANARIDRSASIAASACIGADVVIGARTRIGPGTIVFADTRIVYVSHGVSIGERAWLSAGTAVAGHASIAADALLGIGSVVIDNVNLEAGVLVGGGSVVTKHAPAGAKLHGVPAHPVPAMGRFGPTPRD